MHNKRTTYILLLAKTLDPKRKTMVCDTSFLLLFQPAATIKITDTAIAIAAAAATATVILTIAVAVAVAVAVATPYVAIRL